MKYDRNLQLQYYGDPINLETKKCYGKLSPNGKYLFLWEAFNE